MSSLHPSTPVFRISPTISVFSHFTGRQFEAMAAIGIDLGTTYSCVALWQCGRVEIIANDFGNRTTPSYVAFTDDGRYVGEAAKNQIARNPRNTVYDAKRLIGKSINDETVQQDRKRWPFEVISKNSRTKIQVGRLKYCFGDDDAANGEVQNFAPSTVLEETMLLITNVKVQDFL